MKFFYTLFILAILLPGTVWYYANTFQTGTTQNVLSIFGLVLFLIFGTLTAWEQRRTGIRIKRY